MLHRSINLKKKHRLLAGASECMVEKMHESSIFVCIEEIKPLKIGVVDAPPTMCAMSGRTCWQSSPVR